MDLLKSIYFKLFIASLFCILLQSVRMSFTQTHFFFFLNWNLFLAFAPLFWILGFKFFAPSRSIFRNVILFVGWLLLFPNAPYIFTDLMHLSKGSNAPIWFDILLILSYSLTGIIAGFLSLKLLLNEFSNYFSNFNLNLLTVGLLFLSAFGIYLGRFQRFNSWDILHRPMHILGDVANRFLHPFDHPRTWGITLGLGVFLNLFYWFFKDVLDSKTKDQIQQNKFRELELLKK